MPEPAGGQSEFPDADRSSFLMESLGHVMAAVTELLGIVALFSRFGSIRGWTLSEVALFYGVVHVVFAVAEGVGRGFDSLGTRRRSA